MIKEYNRKNLDKDLESGKKVYLYFQSLGCGPCNLISPSVENFAKDRNDVHQINSSEGRDLAHYLGVVSYPTFVVVEDNQIIEHLVGANPISTFLNSQWFYGTSNN